MEKNFTIITSHQAEGSQRNFTLAIALLLLSVSVLSHLGNSLSLVLVVKLVICPCELHACGNLMHVMCEWGIEVLFVFAY